jgi:Core histone H2A/H2B/H3/H4
MTKKAVTTMTNLCDDIFDKIMHDAVQIAKMNKKKTINCAEIQTAARLLLPGQLGIHGVSEATKAIKSIQPPSPPFLRQVWWTLAEMRVEFDANKPEKAPKAKAGR